MSFFAKLSFYPTSLWLRWRIAAARSVLQGRFRWKALDALGFPGHGKDVLRVDFPPAKEATPRWGQGHALHPELVSLISGNTPAQLELLRACLAHAERYRTWPVNEDCSRPALPWRKNLFLTPFDQIALYGLLRHCQPKRYLEIGSGMSTRIAWQARQDGAFPMEIISIDPEPRFAVAALCDRVHQKRLEDMSGETLSSITPDTFVFFDGSHRCFPASDVTVFFLELLPRLPAGTMAHIHDIYLPADYPAETFIRYWSEQYILAAYLLGGGQRLEIILPCAHLATQSAARALLNSALGPEAAAAGGSSFWLRKT